MKQPIVSIIVPIYNVEKYLSDCIESLVNQTYKNIEIILVNDGSTDSSLSICEKYQVNDSRIKLINLINSGVSKARNEGIKISTGEFVRFVDSDDIIPLNSIEESIAYTINDENIDLIIFPYKMLYTYKEKIFKSNYQYITKETLIKQNFFEKIINFDQKGLINSPCNKLYNLNVIKNKNLYFDEQMKYGEDAKFNFDYFKCLSDTSKVALVPTIGYYYFIRKNKLTLSCNYNNFNYNLINNIYTFKINFLKENFVYTENSFILLQMFSKDIISYYYKISKNKYKNFRDICNKKFNKEKFIELKKEINSSPIFYKVGWHISIKSIFAFYIYLKVAMYIRNFGDIIKLLFYRKGNYYEKERNNNNN